VAVKPHRHSGHRQPPEEKSAATQVIFVPNAPTSPTCPTNLKYGAIEDLDKRKNRAALIYWCSLVSGANIRITYKSVFSNANIKSVTWTPVNVSMPYNKMRLSCVPEAYNNRQIVQQVLNTTGLPYDL
jgi:hypothetical protein